MRCGMYTGKLHDIQRNEKNNYTRNIPRQCLLWYVYSQIVLIIYWSIISTSTNNAGQNNPRIQRVTFHHNLQKIYLNCVKILVLLLVPQSSWNSLFVFCMLQLMEKNMQDDERYPATNIPSYCIMIVRMLPLKLRRRS